MPNYYLSVLYKHIIQVKNKNVGLKVGGHKHTFAPPIKKVWGGAHAPLAPKLFMYRTGLGNLVKLRPIHNKIGFQSAESPPPPPPPQIHQNIPGTESKI